MKFIFTDQESKTLVTSVTKVYPTIIKHYVYQYPMMLRATGFELSEKLVKRGSEVHPDTTPIVDYFEESLRRTKTTISDLVLSNSFEHFVTFTFTKDRQDIKKSKDKMSEWLHSQQKKYGKFEYLIVPEFHKDGKSIHFHALFQGYRGQLTKTNKKIGGRLVYNIASYKKGFTTLVVIDNHEKVSSYIKKYITKDMPKMLGKKRYWCSMGLQRPYKIQNYDVLKNPFIKFKKQYENNGFTIYKSTDTIKTLSNITGEKEQWQTKQLLTCLKKEQLNQLTLNQDLQKHPEILMQLSLLNSPTAIFTTLFAQMSKERSSITWQKISKKRLLVHS